MLRDGGAMRRQSRPILHRTLTKRRSPFPWDILAALQSDCLKRDAESNSVKCGVLIPMTDRPRTPQNNGKPS